LIDSPGAGLVSHGVWSWLLLWPVALWFVHRTYQLTRPAISPSGLLTLKILRATTISLIVALLIEPILVYIQQHARYPTVVTLLDDSQSMAVREEGRTRWQVVADTLASGLDQVLSHTIVGRFSESARIGEWATQSLEPPSGHATDLASALEQASLWGAEAGRLHSVVVLSDGRHNLGQDPVAWAAKLGVPVHTLGVGGSTPPDDIQIVDVVLPPILYAGRGSSLTVGLRQWGYGGETLTVQVSVEDEEIATAQYVPAGAGTYTPTTVELPPLPAGLQTLHVRVAPQPGEITHENNSERLLALVRPHRQRVLVIAGSPSADLSFLRRALTADSSLVCRFSVISQADLSQLPDDLPDDLAATDVLVLHDLARGQLTRRQVEGLATFVRSGGGLLVVAGERTARTGGWATSDLLPLLMPGVPLRTPAQPLQLATEGQHHPAVRLSGAGGGEWSRLPPLTGVGSIASIPRGAVPLLQAGEQVVATAQSLGQGRLISVVGAGFWRLDLLAQGAGESPHTIRRFWQQSVQWLGLRGAAKRVRSTPLQAVVKHGLPAQVQIEVFDELMQPFTDPGLSFQLNGETQYPSVQHLGTGRFLAVWQGLPPGEYSYQLRATAKDNVLGDDRGRFVIVEQSIETSDQRRDEELLKRVAQASGGEYRPLAQWRQIADRLSPPPALVREKRQVGIEVTDLWWLIVLVILLGAEWILRKRWGLL
jgi:hypothetical protein